MQLSIVLPNSLFEIAASLEERKLHAPKQVYSRVLSASVCHPDVCAIDHDGTKVAFKFVAMQSFFASRRGAGTRAREPGSLSQRHVFRHAQAAARGRSTVCSPAVTSINMYVSPVL